jgi:hypothetical protein
LATRTFTLAWGVVVVVVDDCWPDVVVVDEVDAALDLKCGPTTDPTYPATARAATRATAMPKRRPQEVCWYEWRELTGQIIGVGK